MLYLVTTREYTVYIPMQSNIVREIVRYKLT